MTSPDVFTVMLPVTSSYGTSMVPNRIMIADYKVYIDDMVHGWMPIANRCTREERKLIIKAFQKRAMAMPKAGGEL